MCRVFKLEILESPETLESLLKEEKDIRKRERLQFLYCSLANNNLHIAMPEMFQDQHIEYREA